MNMTWSFLYIFSFVLGCLAGLGLAYARKWHKKPKLEQPGDLFKNPAIYSSMIFELLKEKQKKEEKTREDYRQRCDEMKPFLMPGDHFNYLGLDMLCTGYVETNDVLEMPHRPYMCAEYVLPDGKIEQRTFLYKDLPILKSEAERG